MTASESRPYFPNLDALRFWAFLAVFSFHKFYQEFAYTTDSPLANILSGVFSKGNVSVNFFFILSSFLITYFLLRELKDRQHIRLSAFYIKRILRTWPLYFLSLVIGFLIIPVFADAFHLPAEEKANPWYYVGFLSNFDMIRNGIPQFGGLGVFWTLSVEEQYYLLWPLLLLFFRNKHVWLFAFIIAIALLFRSFHYTDHVVMYFHTLSVMTDLAIGGALAYLFLHYPIVLQRITDLSRAKIVLCYVLGLGLTLGWYLGFKHTPLSIFERLTVGALFAFIIAEQVLCKHSFYKAGNWHVAAYWGKKSYALYCFHCLGILLARWITDTVGWEHSDMIILGVETLLALLISFFFGWLSEVAIEAPMRQWKHQLVSKK